MKRLWPLALLPLLTGASDPPAWTRPVPPVHLIGPIDYVGTEGLAAYLIRTPAGAILIDGTMAENVPAIRANIERIGVRARDVKLLLVTHAHFDHAAGDAAMKAATGARLVAGAGDRSALETGKPGGENIGGAVDFAPVRVDRAVRDGDVVSLGGITLTARATPGHTPGCTTWTMRVIERGRPLAVVFPCSISVAGNRLVGNRAYPQIVADYRTSFARLAALPADVVLPAHPELADVMARRAKGTLVAPGLLRRLVARARLDFGRELARQQAGPRR
ncbi:MAG TPA: subclass B3 metallo-beta-lactamase [Sphingomonas sp.]|nr:subclass B3 metallo-beta-lactamase [Sphingomonas sp.]